MNRTISSRGSTRATYGRVCAISTLVMLMGLCLTIGGVTFDAVLVRNIGLATFAVAASLVLVVVLIAHRLAQS